MPVAEAEPGPIDPAPPQARRPGTITTRRKVGVGIAIAGVAALGVGGWLGSQARSDDRDAYALCPDASVPCADAAQATALSDRAGARALYANIGLSVGAAAIIGAAILWFTGSPEAPSNRATTLTPTVQPGLAGLALVRSF